MHAGRKGSVQGISFSYFGSSPSGFASGAFGFGRSLAFGLLVLGLLLQGRLEQVGEDAELGLFLLRFLLRGRLESPLSFPGPCCSGPSSCFSLTAARASWTDSSSTIFSSMTRRSLFFGRGPFSPSVLGFRFLNSLSFFAAPGSGGVGGAFGSLPLELLVAGLGLDAPELLGHGLEGRLLRRVGLRHGLLVALGESGLAGLFLLDEGLVVGEDALLLVGLGELRRVQQDVLHVLLGRLADEVDEMVGPQEVEGVGRGGQDGVAEDR